MRSPSRWKTLGGVLAVLATAALSSPGVHAERASAEERGAVAAREGPMCRPSEPPAVHYDVRALRRAIAAEAARAPEGERPEIVVLNGRGYNYPRPGEAPAAPPHAR